MGPTGDYSQESKGLFKELTPSPETQVSQCSQKPGPPVASSGWLHEGKIINRGCHGSWGHGLCCRRGEGREQSILASAPDASRDTVLFRFRGTWSTGFTFQS